ncbi:MAG: AAA family ATPase [Prevotellaceae bacterium]|nr:AAA family ATPase [Candidatus Faecinaster equi]
MCKLKVENIGSIKKIDIELNKLTVILGPQSSGKSTIAKLICFCQWVEKRCFINFEENSNRFMKDGEFVRVLAEYHRMDEYIRENSFLNYEGNFITIILKDVKVAITKVSSDLKYVYPKICYIPAERNIVAAIPNVKKYNDTNDSMLYFMYDWFEARSYIKDVNLGNLLQREIQYHYDEKTDKDVVYDGDVPLQLMNASSGVQSILPLYTVLNYSFDSIYKRYKPLSSEQKEQVNNAMKILSEQLNGAFKDAHEKGERVNKITLEIDEDTNSILIPFLHKDRQVLDMFESARRSFFYENTHVYVEEPEQNLFPDTQAKFVYWFMHELQNADRNHTALITTHSPYVLFALNNCLMGGFVGDSVSEEDANDMLSRKGWISPSSVVVYEIHDGQLKKIQDEDGLLDNNYLNKAYKTISSEYLSMLSYYE